MSRNNNKKRPVEGGTSKQSITKYNAQVAGFNLSTFLHSFRLQAFILAAIAFIFYYNTFSNEFALDDVMVIQQNDYVHEGFSGIPGILSKDTYDGYYRHMNTENQFSGGRYRPLSVVTFAIEEELLGKDADENPALGQSISAHAATYMHTRHVVNVMLYMLSVIVFLYFLRYVVFQQSPFAAFVAALLFTIHPVHTEVVANIKSRDEILSFLFICLTLIYAYGYQAQNKKRTLAAALVCYALALFSKEYAITLIAIIPLMFYVFSRLTLRDSLKAVWPYAVMLAAYLLVRFSVISHKGAAADTGLQNNPYLYATGLQKIATEISTLLNYLKLLLWPYPLSADYSYNQVPYTSLSGTQFWASLVIHLALIAAYIKLFIKRHVLSFAIAFYLTNLLIVSNLFFNLGATMGERLIYHSSAGFVIAVAWCCAIGWEKIQKTKMARAALLAAAAILVFLCGSEVIARNVDWKDTNTLFAKDVQTVPNSFLANGIAGTGYCAMSDMPENKDKRMELVNKGISYIKRAIAINDHYVQGYYNLALAYNITGEFDKELIALDSVKKNYPAFPNLAEQYIYLYHDQGLAFWKAHKYDEAIKAYKEGCKVAPGDPEMWYMLGITYYTVKDYPAAIAAWDVTLKLNPNHTAAKTAYAAAQKFMNGPAKK